MILGTIFYRNLTTARNRIPANFNPLEERSKKLVTMVTVVLEGSKSKTSWKHSCLESSQMVVPFV